MFLGIFDDRWLACALADGEQHACTNPRIVRWAHPRRGPRIGITSAESNRRGDACAARRSRTHAV